MLTYRGDCITGLDDEGFRNTVASDATELGQLVWCENDDVRHLSPEEFAQLVDVLPEHRHYLQSPTVFLGSPELGYNDRAEVAWIWDDETDTHYFYA